MTPDTPASPLPRLAPVRPRPAQAPVLAFRNGDRAIKVLQARHAPAQLSLFPPPGSVARGDR